MQKHLLAIRTQWTGMGFQRQLDHAGLADCGLQIHPKSAQAYSRPIEQFLSLHRL